LKKHKFYVLGIFVGGYHYSLKMFTFEKVRARNFARAWGFVQFSQVISLRIKRNFIYSHMFFRLYQ
jgi:hypothetical protein